MDDVEFRHHFRRLEAKLDTVLFVLAQGEQREVTMAKTLDDVLASVAQLATVEQSLETLCDGLSTQLRDALAAGDTAKIQGIADQLDARRAEVAAAVTRNTPAAGGGAGGGTPGQPAQQTAHQTTAMPPGHRPPQAGAPGGQGAAPQTAPPAGQGGQGGAGRPRSQP